MGTQIILDSTVNLAGAILSISGAPTDLRHMDITWHASQFIFVAEGPHAEQATTVYAGHVPIGNRSPFVTHAFEDVTGYDAHESPRIASVGDTLGVVARKISRASGAEFHTLDADGVPVTSVLTAGGMLGDISPSGTSFTVATYATPTANQLFNTIRLATGATDGTLGPFTTRDDIPGIVENLRLAQVDSIAGLVYTDSSAAQPSVQLLRWSGENVLGPTELSASAQSADIASLSSDRFAIAWSTAEGFRLQVRTSTGTVACDSEPVAFGNGVLDALDSVAVAESSLGIVVAVADSGATTGLAAAFIFNDDCERLTEGGKALFNNQLPEHQYRPHEPRIAVGGGNIAFTWTAEDSGSYRSYVRVMPEAMCE